MFTAPRLSQSRLNTSRRHSGLSKPALASVAAAGALLLFATSAPAAQAGLPAATPAQAALANKSPAPPSDAPGSNRTGELGAHSLRTPVTGENFYFVMADRFSNGDAGNDDGGLGPDPMVSGFDPTRKGFYNGGDLNGLLNKIDYIQGLGTTAIWLTPSFKNKAVQPEDNSAGYHGYWVTDFTQIDPHLGTNADLKALIDEAHSRGMKVYLTSSLTTPRT